MGGRFNVVKGAVTLGTALNNAKSSHAAKVLLPEWHSQAQGLSHLCLPRKSPRSSIVPLMPVPSIAAPPNGFHPAAHRRAAGARHR